ncbi:HAD-IA family hydrolase [candidate division KSB3 bacterium]|uniref:HAD-IA family hydrolase n=1 Tax=candidate division KSB3 bacterium TaxID=2044937 RepID=A0A9D5JWK0_9BACT|nr:HAD-IA family hydrolase [candidate division KSB3 bacterium]MBD3325553.1 HAD-IA family hydrolase [candidate division KSB3 bacterium]
MATLHAVIFDQDGVLADTERDGHRVAFNRAFREFDLAIEWDVDTYGSLLKVGGGKERMRHYIVQEGLDAQFDDLDDLIKRLHKRKTEIFMELIETGQIGLRPGVKRLIQEVHDAGLKLAVCSTSNEKAVNTLVRTLLGDEIYGWFDHILAGDVVQHKKPNPEIYNLAQTKLGIDPRECIVIEDNRNGLMAAVGAGMKCLVTVNAYTKHEELPEAELVVSCLGDPDGERAEVLAGKQPDAQPFEGYVTLPLLHTLVRE